MQNFIVNQYKSVSYNRLCDVVNLCLQEVELINITKK